MNPTLKAAYSTAGGQFVDVTKATGAYTPFSKTTPYGRYGSIPMAVVDVCELTYYCQLQDPHPNNPRLHGHRPANCPDVAE